MSIMYVCVCVCECMRVCVCVFVEPRRSKQTGLIHNPASLGGHDKAGAHQRLFLDLMNFPSLYNQGGQGGARGRKKEKVGRKRRKGKMTGKEQAR